ncbi:MAG TPA: hypothetical protein VMX75_05725 [Spirochaetia bacterium]|nr:hypothetical protein [Spirochaetia bacterium]
MQIEFFDCNTMIGRRILRSHLEFKSADDLIREMDHLAISDALVYHAHAKEYSPAIGNDRLMEEIATHDRLHPCWVIMPSHTGEMERPDELIRKILDRSVRAVRMFPSPPTPPHDFTMQLHRYALIESVCGELLQVLQKHRIPLFLETQTFLAFPLVSWESIEWILKTYTGLPLVIGGIRQRDNRTLYALMERFKSLHLDISLYGVHRGLEDFTQRFGAKRLVFGTGLPVFAGSGAITQLLYAEIEESEKQQIAGGNLQRLLGGIRNGD